MTTVLQHSISTLHYRCNTFLRHQSNIFLIQQYCYPTGTCQSETIFWAYDISSYVYTGCGKQWDCSATDAQKNRNLEIQQEHLHRVKHVCSRNVTALSLGVTKRQFNFETKLLCGKGCHEWFSLKDTDLRNCWYMDYTESHITATYHVNVIVVQHVAP